MSLPLPLDNLLRRLTVEAEVDRVLVLSGDRDKPAGDLVSSLQILKSGLIEKHGIRSVAISAGRRQTYPDLRLVYWAGGNPLHWRSCALEGK